MRRHAGLIIVIAVLAVLVGIFIVWPIVDMELMKIPMTDGVSALRKKDVATLRKSFTPDAIVFVGNEQVPVTTVLDQLEKMLATYPVEMGSFRFAEYANQQRHWGRMEADFTIVAQVGGDSEDNPYHGSVPIRKKGHVVLVRQGIFHWKIAQLKTDDEQLNKLIEGLGALDMLEKMMPMGGR